MGPQLDLPVTLQACESALAAPSTDLTEQCRNSFDDHSRMLNAAYDLWVLNDRGRAFGWQRINGIVLFITALSILAFGFFLTWLEFGKAREKPVELEIGTTGVKVSSEVIGIVILIIALTFTYLYIDRIYPISEVGGEGQSDSQAEIIRSPEINEDTVSISTDAAKSICRYLTSISEGERPALDSFLSLSIDELCGKKSSE